MNAFALSVIILSFAYTLPHGSTLTIFSICYHWYADGLLKTCPLQTRQICYR